MSKLKPLKDIFGDLTFTEGCYYCDENREKMFEIRREAIKWVKKAICKTHKNIEDSVGFLDFFNLTDEDIK